MKPKDVDFFEKVKGQLHQLHGEVSVLSKSKPDNAMNKFKLGFINEILEAANAILIGEFKPFKTFTLFDADDLPTNSDIVLVLSQYLDCLEAWRCANIYYSAFHWYWTLEGEQIETKPSSRYRETNSEDENDTSTN